MESNHLFGFRKPKPHPHAEAFSGALARICTEVCVGCSHVPCYLATSAESVDSTGIEPVSQLCESRILPLEYEPNIFSRARDEDRTRLALIDNQRTSPDVSTSNREGEIGFEPITVRLQRPTFYQLNYSPLMRAFVDHTGIRTPISRGASAASYR